MSGQVSDGRGRDLLRATVVVCVIAALLFGAALLPAVGHLTPRRRRTPRAVGRRAERRL